MYLHYNNFLNEIRISDFEVGSKVIIKGSKMNHYVEPVNHETLNLADKIATVKEVKKEKDRYGYGQTYITFTLDEPVTKKVDLYTRGGVKVKLQLDIKIEEIKLTRDLYQHFEIITPEYEELQKKLKSGELYKFQATREFNLILKNIKFRKTGEFFDASYFDVVSGNTDMISYIPSKKMTPKNFDFSKKGDVSVYDPEKFRQETRVGRILKKLNSKLTDQELEEFVNKFRAEAEALYTTPDIQVVTGKEISYWYHEKHYQKGGGTLNNSCMRGVYAQEQVKFYDRFPDKVALAIYVKGDKLWGRALVWRLDDGRVYMDRIYSVKAEAAVQLEKYAKKFNMIMRKDPISVKTAMKVTLKGSANITHPYFDTFIYRYVDKKNIILSNQAVPGLRNYY